MYKRKGEKDGSTEAGEVFYAAGYIKHFLDNFARSCTLSADELASRVAALLLAQTGGQVLGTDDRVPALRGKSATRNKAARKVALARGAHGKASVKKLVAKIHSSWTAKRRKEYSRRMKKNQRKLQAARHKLSLVA